MHDQIVALAERPTKEEALEAIEGVLKASPSEEPTTEEISADLAADRR